MTNDEWRQKLKNTMVAAQQGDTISPKAKNVGMKIFYVFYSMFIIFSFIITLSLFMNKYNVLALFSLFLLILSITFFILLIRAKPLPEKTDLIKK